MSVVIVTGSAGLIGSEAVRHFAALGLDVVGIDNDMRRQFFGAEASTAWNVLRLDQRARRRRTPTATSTSATGTRSRRSSDGYGRDIALVIHTAAQPSHDWAVRDPYTDFGVNAVGTLNVLQNDARALPRGAVHPLLDQQGVRRHAQHAAPGGAGDPLGDRPRTTRTPTASPRTCRSTRRLHSVFGASKVAADVMVQEYGRYFDMRTACFRGGTLTGPAHSATELHGFLGYVMRCAMDAGRTRSSATRASRSATRSTPTTWWPRSRRSSARPASARSTTSAAAGTPTASVLEAIALSEKIAGSRDCEYSYVDTNRVGDHIWWIGSNARFADALPRLAADLRRAGDPAGDPRGQRRPVAAG